MYWFNPAGKHHEKTGKEAKRGSVSHHGLVAPDHAIYSSGYIADGKTLKTSTETSLLEEDSPPEEAQEDNKEDSED